MHRSSFLAGHIKTAICFILLTVSLFRALGANQADDYQPEDTSSAKSETVASTPAAVPVLSKEVNDLVNEMQDALAYVRESMIPRIVLPDVFHAVVGDTLQLFYRGIIEAPYPYFYDIDIQCDIGKATPRYFEITPTEEQNGVHDLTIRICDFRGNILTGKSTKIMVHTPKKASSEMKNVLCIGDSLTSGGQWPYEALRRFVETGGIPKGLGFNNIRFIGTKTKENCGFEGYPGWAWRNFLNEPQKTSLDMWCYCSHDKDDRDTHSLWEDKNGNIWSLETIEKKRLKFTRYDDHKGEMPTGEGVLKHHGNAFHSNDIIFSDTAYAEGNPFWNPKKKCVDFRYYCEVNGFEKIDCLVTLLTWNKGATNEGISKAVNRHANYAKELFRSFHRDFPDAKVKLLGIQMPSINGGTGENYGANLPPLSHWYGLVNYVMEMNLAYQKLANENEFKDYVEFICISAQFDSEYNMRSSEKSVNTRNGKSELIGTNGVHPDVSGYLQIGDAVFRALVPELTE